MLFLVGFSGLRGSGLGMMPSRSGRPSVDCRRPRSRSLRRLNDELVELLRTLVVAGCVWWSWQWQGVVVAQAVGVVPLGLVVVLNAL